MTPEEWLRERGIDITRRPGSARPGELASQHTHALPSLPDDDNDEEDVESLRTRIVPTVVKLDLRLGGDVAEWPTAALPEPPAGFDITDRAEAFVLDANDDEADSFDEIDYAIEDEMTVPLPIITPEYLTPPPDPASTVPGETLSPVADETAAADDAPSDITATPTRRLA